VGREMQGAEQCRTTQDRPIASALWTVVDSINLKVSGLIASIALSWRNTKRGHCWRRCIFT